MQSWLGAGLHRSLRPGFPPLLGLLLLATSCPSGSRNDGLPVFPIGQGRDEVIAGLVQRDPELAELVRLRCFAGLGLELIAQSLGRSLRSVHRDWDCAKALLMKALAGE